MLTFIKLPWCKGPLTTGDGIDPTFGIDGRDLPQASENLKESHIPMKVVFYSNLFWNRY